MKKDYIDRARNAVRGLDPKVLVIEIAVIIVFIAAVVLFLVVRYPDITHAFSSIRAFEAFMEEHKSGGAALYIAIQAVQVIAAFIPGQIIQIAGGYLYGFWFASLYSVIGIAIGSGVAFYLARAVGKGPVKRVYGAEMVDHYTELLSSRNAFALMLFLYIIPGFPKDVMAFFAGLSNIKFSRFLPVATIARFPAMAVSMLIGAQLGVHSYKASIAIAAVFAAAAGICYVFRKPLIRLSDRYFGFDNESGEKINKM